MNESQNPQAYQTGPTTPPKSHGGLIALVLVTAIFLTGLLRLLQLMNIPLVQLRSGQQKSDISAISQYQADPQPAAYKIERSGCGIQGQLLSDVCRNYYGLPQGICITFVGEYTIFYQKGLRSGDILLEINGEQITDLSALEILNGQGSQTLQLRYYRQGQYAEICVQPSTGGQ